MKRTRILRRLALGLATVLLVGVLSSGVLLAAAASAGTRQKLYVLSSNADDVTVVDVATNKILGSIEVGKLPHGIATPKSQHPLYVATEGDDGLAVVDPVKDVLIKKYDFFGRRPNEIETTSDGRFVYVPAMRDGTYEVFDTKQEKIITRIRTNGTPHNTVVSPDDKYMYLVPHDRGTRSVEQARKEGRPTTLNRKIYIVDVARHDVVGTISTGNAPRPTTISPDGKRLYVNTDNLMGFLVIDIAKRKVIHTARYNLTDDEKATPSRCHGIGATPDGREVWSTNINHGFVHVFDVTKEPPVEIAKIKTGNTPLWLTMTPDGKTVYTANTADDTISVFDRATKKERTRIQLPKGKAPKRMLVLTVPTT